MGYYFRWHYKLKDHKLADMRPLSRTINKLD